MKDYLKQFNNNTTEANRAVMQDINSSLAGKEIDSDTYGIGRIKSVNNLVTNADNEQDFSVTISFDKLGDKSLYLLIASRRGAITLRDTEAMIVSEYTKALKTISEERTKQLKELINQSAIEQARIEAERQAQLEATEKARKAREEAIKLANRKEKAKQKFNELCRQAKIQGTSINNEDLIIGWLAKHVTRISAEIPDFLEKQFIHNFGATAEKTVVNTAIKSSGGFTKKWSLSCSIHVDDLDTMPPALQEVFKGNKQVNSVSFALNLIYNYGFTFGKTQDINQIKTMITDSNAFSIGYAS